MKNNDLKINNLEISNVARASLKRTAKWSKFLAITGFIMLGIMLMVIIGLIISGMFVNKGFSTLAIPFVYIIIIVVYFFPIFNLYKFAKKTLVALNTNTQKIFEDGLSCLAYLYKFIGILMIIALCFYVVAFFLGLSTGFTSAYFKKIIQLENF